MSVPLQSNFLASLAVDVRADMTAYRRATIEAHRAYLRAGKRLVEARGEAKRGEWGPFLSACGISERTARNMIRIARGGWHPKTLTAIGGVRTALDFEALATRLTDLADLPAAEVAARTGPPAIAARKGGESFVAFCQSHDEEPSDVIRRLVDGLPRRSKPETVSGNGGSGSSGPSARIPDDLDERRAEVAREIEADQARIKRLTDETAARVKRELERRFKPASVPIPDPAVPYRDTERWPGESAADRLRRLRSERRAAGRCADCGAPSGDAYRCDGCTTKRATASDRAASRRRIGRALEGQIRMAAARGKGVRLTAADVRALVDGERKEFGDRLAKIGASKGRKRGDSGRRGGHRS